MTVWEGLSPPYATICVDPPWHYTKINPDAPRYVDAEGRLRSTGINAKGGGLPYSTMTLDEIKALPVGDLAEDTRCFLWTTNRYLRHAWGVLEAWGFEPQDRTLVWCKPPMGNTPVTTEFVLIGKKGKPPRMPWHNSTWFAWPRPHHKNSTKPDAFFDLVEKWCPGPYVELFARAPHLGWSHWGLGHEMPAKVAPARTPFTLLPPEDLDPEAWKLINEMIDEAEQAPRGD